MRGAVGLLSWDECIGWGRKALSWLKEHGEKPSAIGFSKAFRAMGAPFNSQNAVTLHHGKTFVEYRAECMGVDSATVGRDGATFQCGNTMTLGPGVSVNAVQPHNWEASWATLTNAYEDRKRAQANEVDRSVRIASDGPVCVLVLGDMHIGSPSVDYPRLLWVAEQLNRTDVQVYAVFVGDCVDSMIWNSVKYEGRASPLSVHKEVLTAVGWMKQANASGHMIGGVCGNHDLVSEKMAGLSHFLLAMEQAESKIPIAKNELLLAVTVGSKSDPGQTYKWEIRHATKGSSVYQRAAGPIRHNRNNHRDTDILIAGHLHKSAHYKEERHGKKRYSIQVGSYKVADLDDYAVENGFERGDNEPDFGVILWPDRHRIEVLESEVAIERIEAFARGGPGCGPKRGKDHARLRVPVPSARRRSKQRRRKAG